MPVFAQLTRKPTAATARPQPISPLWSRRWAPTFGSAPTKAWVSQPQDASEQEASRVAEQVVAVSDPALPQASPRERPPRPGAWKHLDLRTQSRPGRSRGNRDAAPRRAQPLLPRPHGLEFRAGSRPYRPRCRAGKCHWKRPTAASHEAYLQQEIDVRVETEEYLVRHKRPPTEPDYRTPDGKVNVAAIESDVHGSPRDNPTNRTRLCRPSATSGASPHRTTADVFDGLTGFVGAAVQQVFHAFSQGGSRRWGDPGAR